MTFDLDVALKGAQSLFYFSAIVLGILTYIRARTTILNTVNTEYHKKVIERLSEVGELLYREFDSTSDDYWGRSHDVDKIADALHSEIRDFKEEIISSGECPAGILVGPTVERLGALLNRYKSDPFLPDQVRTKIVDLLENRLSSLETAHILVFEEYMAALGQGKYWETLDSNKYWLHNKVMERIRKDGFGIEEVERRIHDIRLEIQKYFKKFEP